jgi:hypothetical protein
MMGKGKILMVCGGILTLISTYVLAWYAISINYFTYYTNGIGGIKNFLNLFLHGESYASTLGVPLWIVYISSVLIVFTLISGVLQLLALKKRIWGIVGSIVPILIGIMIILGFSLYPEWITYFQLFGDRNPLISEGFPLNLAIPGRPESLGTYLLLAGGILGVIGFYYLKEEIY